jgi:hypothetical protein
MPSVLDVWELSRRAILAGGASGCGTVIDRWWYSCLGLRMGTPQINFHERRYQKFLAGLMAPPVAWTSIPQSLVASWIFETKESSDMP